jgi:hypothetical protein
LHPIPIVRTRRSAVIAHYCDAIDLTNDADINPFIGAYLGSIQKARNISAGQWRECNWDKKSLDVQAPTTIAEVICHVYSPLRYYLTFASISIS